MTSFLFSFFFLSFFFSSPILLFFSFLPAAATRRKKEREPSHALEKLVRKLGIFPFLSCSRIHIEPRNLSPSAGKSGSALLCPPAAFVVGANCLGFG
ncbi:hypothetical protein SLEP1_g18195 [Rubroshorea leprosula]|uniref:Secreted protein n=1 Tax=Rubroshorea leprosula TaxID=152421 RepID=A0AAV5J0A6_9ROSI|nr:hypothetical protein SLEP1_g18195 [Rubroshorea leprosula]